ncbi:unnamed protein product [Arctia plantaginis]|uniref:Uncharacterized protein n=1 Tax=Arctia plantaginis TaxID=874455 RepID=A0A8S1A3R6_ARCPL|nr:unnamed protein product [Arctia plantaginis]
MFRSECVYYKNCLCVVLVELSNIYGKPIFIGIKCLEDVRAYPSARAGTAAVAGPRAPPTASGAPARPCQRREAAPRAPAAAAAAPRRAITAPTPATPTPPARRRTPASLLGFIEHDRLKIQSFYGFHM